METIFNFFSGVIILTYVANRFRLHKLDKVEKFVMSYGGLRGAVAFALVLLIDPKHVPLQPMFMTTTIAVIYFTVFFQGITIKPLVKILNVKRAEKRKPTMNERIHERVSFYCFLLMWPQKSYLRPRNLQKLKKDLFLLLNACVQSL